MQLLFSNIFCFWLVESTIEAIDVEPKDKMSSVVFVSVSMCIYIFAYISFLLVMDLKFKVFLLNFETVTGFLYIYYFFKI